MPDNIPQADPRDYIVIRGARQHNLKGLDLNLPKRSIVVITGPSGSGKSSLAFDTIFAEGQRRYMESLSAYARQFLKRIDKPDVDVIMGLSPAIAIQQQTLSRNPRSTVATQTEIYDHLRMLFAQIGTTVSPVSGKVVTRDSPRSVAESLQKNLADGTRFYVTFKFRYKAKRKLQALETLRQRGFFRLLARRRQKITLVDLNEVDLGTVGGPSVQLYVLQDRLIVRPGDEVTTSRIADSVEQAFVEGQGNCHVLVLDAHNRSLLADARAFSVFFERDGLKFAEPTPNLFSFNSPIGACPDCQGFGYVNGPDSTLIIPDDTKSIIDGVIKPFESPQSQDSKEQLLLLAKKKGIDVNAPYRNLPLGHKRIIWRGEDTYEGLLDYFRDLQKDSSPKPVRFHHARFQGFERCMACFGSRLCPEALYVKVGKADLGQIISMTARDARDFFDTLSLTSFEMAAAGILLEEIRKRLHFLVDVGLEYLTLDRQSQTLSGGETQRIALATSLGSALVGALYVLDEPTIGLHPRDTLRLISVLQKLRDLGNTVVVVEHDAEVMRHADHIVDLGPGAGHLGGRLMFAGSLNKIFRNGQSSVTGAYLSGKKEIPVPVNRRPA